MVWSSSVNNKRAQLEIHGVDVTADNEGCGTNSNLVYFAWFWEDDARDDPEDPGSEIVKELP